MSVYDPFNQGYAHDWRLEEAVRAGVERAMHNVIANLESRGLLYPRERVVFKEAPMERTEGQYTNEEVQRMIQEAVREERRKVILEVQEKITELIQENQRLKERVERLERERKK
jgi:hypothetical protein